MRVVVLGATGGTGRELVRQARDAGYEVAAFDRNGGAPFSRAIDGQDAVISTTGRGRSFRANGLTEQTVPMILSAMKAARARRLIHDRSAFGYLVARADGAASC